VAGIVPTAAANRNFDPTFTAELASKDVGLALAAGLDTGTDLEIGSHVRKLFDRLIGAGLGQKDCSAIVSLLDGSTGDLR
jgi:3-hydroxyisobutyrate dehydrogenase